MIRTESSHRFAVLLTACAATTIVARNGDIATPQAISTAAQLIAAQRIRAGMAGTLGAPSVTPGGRLVAFVARDPGPWSRSCCHRVYVLDRSTRLLTQETTSSDGTPADGDSQSPSLSSDGRILAFETVASNLVRHSTPWAQRHVIVRDRQNGRLRTPHAMETEDAQGGGSGQPVVSGNGLVIAFTADATNLVPGPDANGSQPDVYFWLLGTREISRVSVDSHGVQPRAGASHSPTISGDGGLIAFVSTARLAPDDINDHADVYVRDVHRSTTSLVSRGAAGTSNGHSYAPALSADGRHLGFVSRKAPADTSQVYVADLATGAVTLVSATSSGAPANADSRRPALSADGRYVVHESVASDLGSGPGCSRPSRDTNLLADVYLLDRHTQCVSRISGSRDREWWTPSIAPAIDGYGTVVLFSSTQPVGQTDPSSDFDLFLSGRMVDLVGPGTTSSARRRPPVIASGLTPGSRDQRFISQSLIAD
jgi:Tol biopolymer transport system component